MTDSPTLINPHQNELPAIRYSLSYYPSGTAADGPRLHILTLPFDLDVWRAAALLRALSCRVVSLVRFEHGHTTEMSLADFEAEET